MLVLSALQNLLAQVLDPPSLHSAVLFTTAGQLISYAADSLRPKDEIRVVVGIAGEVWLETQGEGAEGEGGEGMVDSEVRCISQDQNEQMRATLIAGAHHRYPHC